jgi:hypothetical protein
MEAVMESGVWLDASTLVRSVKGRRRTELRILDGEHLD